MTEVDHGYCCVRARMFRRGLCWPEREPSTATGTEADERPEKYSTEVPQQAWTQKTPKDAHGR